MDYQIEQTGKASVIFEASIAIDGKGFLLIYGEGLSGYWCSIPNWDIGGKMSSPDDLYFNKQQLESYGLESTSAKGLAEAIRVLAKGHQSKWDKFFASLQKDKEVV